MAKTFVCYLHKPGVLTPELRVIETTSEDFDPYEVSNAIAAQVLTWPDFEAIDVYDEGDTKLLTVTKRLVGKSRDARPN